MFKFILSHTIAVASFALACTYLRDIKTNNNLDIVILDIFMFTALLLLGVSHLGKEND